MHDDVYSVRVDVKSIKIDGWRENVIARLSKSGIRKPAIWSDKYKINYCRLRASAA